MKLGSFWGLTAPMIVTLSDVVSKNELKSYVDILNTQVNQSVLESLKVELHFLSRALDNINAAYTLPNTTGSIEGYKGSCSLVAGKIVGPVDADEVYVLLVSDIVDKLVLKLLKALDKDVCTLKLDSIQTCVDSSAVRSIMTKVVVDYLSDKTFKLQKITSVVIDIYKALECESECIDTSVVKQRIIDAFGVVEDVTTTFIVDGERLEIDDNCKKIIQYFFKKKKFIKDFNESIVFQACNEEQVFGLAFADLVQRKPTSLLRLTANKFDYVKYSNATFLLKVLQETRTEITRFQRIFRERVITAGGDKELTAMTDKEYLSVCDSFDDEKSEFFRLLLKRGYLYSKDLLVEDFYSLCTVYGGVAQLSLERISEVYGIVCNSVEFEGLIRTLNKVGICGLNVYNLSLFRESVKSISLVTSLKIEKQQEIVDEFDEVLGTVNALLDTIMPIGEVLTNV